MPAKSEAQRRYMMGWLHSPGTMKGEKPKMAKHKMEEYAVKSHMPKGGSQSPKGDLAELRGREIAGAFPRGFKSKGGRPNVSAQLPYRTPDTAGGSDKVC